MKPAFTRPIGFAARAILAAALLHVGVSAAAGEPAYVSLKEIREHGVVMQKWETSCAAASIATVLTYAFHDPVSERDAAAAMLERTDPAKVRAQGGFSLLDLKRYVEGRGFVGAAYRRLGFDDLRLFRAPIVAINEFGYPHYVVFDGVHDDVVRLADPAFGNRELTRSAFEAAWIDGLAFVVNR